MRFEDLITMKLSTMGQSDFNDAVELVRHNASFPVDTLREAAKRHELLDRLEEALSAALAERLG